MIYIYIYIHSLALKALINFRHVRVRPVHAVSTGRVRRVAGRLRHTRRRLPQHVLVWHAL